MLGNRIREARLARHLSLNDVASRAKISVATLSRIERDKQGLDLNIFMTLSRVLKTPPRDLLGDDETGDAAEPLASRIAAMNSRDRITLWHDLAGERSKQRLGRRGAVRKLAEHVDELMAQIEYLQSEIAAVQRRLRVR